MKKAFAAGLICILAVCIYILSCQTNVDAMTGREAHIPSKEELWQAPDTSLLSDDEQGRLIKYGRNLIANTSAFLGPHGSVLTITNGLNCQSCHLEAGTRPWGNNFGAVASTYPKYRPRSGSIESIEKKINDCLERSMNGRAIDSAGREMRAMVAYMQWLGAHVEKGTTPRGAGLKKLFYPQRAASPERGLLVYSLNCISCHGVNGEGKLNPDKKTFLYPPLWGELSYNTGAGIYRLSKLASFVKYNMPYGVTHKNPVLTDAEAWDVAAYINTRSRPVKDISHDWPDLNTKPVDHPFGPYTDTFTENHHKFGPFAEIEKARAARAF